jgi:hypothetical protein
MKKLGLLSLLLPLIIAGCNKEKEGGPVILQIEISLTDSTGNLLFPNPPPNFSTTPFDPRQSYWITGTGKKVLFSDRVLSGTKETGLLFALAQNYHELEEDQVYRSTKKVEWKVVFHPDSVAYSLVLVNPRLGDGTIDYVIWNNDTLIGANNGGLQIIYP